MRTSSTRRTTGKKVVKRETNPVITVDFTDTEDGFARLKEGEYLLKVSEIIQKESKDDTPYLLWKLKVVEPAEDKGKEIGHITSLQSHALFTLKRTLEALGVEVPRSKFKLSLKKYIGLELGASVENETYQGRKKSVMTDMFPADEYEADEDDGEEEDEDQDDEGEEDEEEEEEEEDEEAEEEEDEEDEEEPEEEEEEEEEEPEPPKKKAKKTEAVATRNGKPTKSPKTSKTAASSTSKAKKRKTEEEDI